jgi:serine/threonine-protein kinase
VNKLPQGGSPTVTVVVAREPLVPVPDVTPQDPVAAAATLGAAGFQVTVEATPSDTAPIGKVLGTNPPIGTPLPRGSAVTLVVSSGPSMIPVPSVVGAQRAAAEALLNGTLGLGLQVNLVNAGPAKKGIVVSQTPPAGTPVPKGSTVAIFVGL